VTDPSCSVFGSDDPRAVTFGLVIPLTIGDGTPGDNAPHWRDAVALAVDELGPAATGDPLATELTHVSGGAAAPLVPLDPPDLDTALSELVDGNDVQVEGASGLLAFDASSGEAPPTGIEIWEIVDGGFSTVKVVPP
jgi:hypothetical protein